MGEKSARKNTPKTPAAKSLKEKRNEKHAKQASATRSENTDAVTKAKKRADG